MPLADSNGTRLYAESTGSGTPIVFVHEFAGDYRNWENQVRYFARRYRCITFNARGYPPSDVPQDPQLYSQSHAVQDIAAVMQHFGVAKAHIVGLSMGAYATLNFGIAHPDLALSLVVAGAGHGSDPHMREQSMKEFEELAQRLLTLGMPDAIADYAQSPNRRRYREKDLRGFEEFNQQFAGHSAYGSAMTLRGCQQRRPTIYQLKEQMQKLHVPTLVITGDDDEPCLEPSVFMKRHIPDAQLLVVPRTSHPVNLEEPDAFNRAVFNFITGVDGRDPRQTA